MKMFSCTHAPSKEAILWGCLIHSLHTRRKKRWWESFMLRPPFLHGGVNVPITNVTGSNCVLTALRKASSGYPYRDVILLTGLCCSICNSVSNSLDRD